MKIVRSYITVIAAFLVALFGFTSCMKGGTFQSLRITPADATMANGTTELFVATAVFSDGTTLNWNAAVTWSSSNTGVATVSDTTGSKGLVTSVGVGTTTITATDLSNNISGSTTITVTNAISFTVTPVNPVISLGTTTQQQFTATETFASGSTLDVTKLVLWSSSNAEVATISNTTGSQGLATAVATGTTSISATDLITNISGTTTLTVTP